MEYESSLLLMTLELIKKVTTRQRYSHYVRAFDANSSDTDPEQDSDSSEDVSPRLLNLDW